MTKFLIYLALLIGLQLVNAQTENVHYKLEDGKIVNQKQLDERIDIFQKLAKQVSKSGELNIIYSDTITKKDSTIVHVELDIKGAGISLASTFQNEVKDKLMGKAFPEFSLSNLENEEVNFKEFKGKPVMINFWFKNCAPCIDEMPALNKLQKKYKNQVHFISITFNKIEEVASFLEENTFNFEHLVNAEKFCDELGISNYPQNIFIDQAGKVVNIESGIPYMMDEAGNFKPGDESYFEDILKKLL